MATLTAAIALGAIPQTISYQGALRQADDHPVPDGLYNLTFRIYDAAMGGSLLWQETQNLQVAHGIFNANLGAVTPLAIPFNNPL